MVLLAILSQNSHALPCFAVLPLSCTVIFQDVTLSFLQAIGQEGAASLLQAVQSKSHDSSSKNMQLQVLTHCNTGSLATASYGTALGIVRALHEQGQLARVYCTETRPFNQGRAIGLPASASGRLRLYCGLHPTLTTLQEWLRAWVTE